MPKRTIWEKVVFIFDRLEDVIRAYLSRHPILFTFIGGVAVVLFWRGVWHTADLIPNFDGPLSFFAGTGILLLTGLFVSEFIGDSIIISGLKKEKKLVERLAEEELTAEEKMIKHIDNELHEIKEDINAIKADHEKTH